MKNNWFIILYNIMKVDLIYWFVNNILIMELIYIYVYII